MIVAYESEGWQVATQRAHGILAGQIASHWKRSARPARWFETVLAITEHDDAENELDGEELITSTGGPLNYTMKSFDRAHCDKLYLHAITKSRYVALLISLHMQFLHGKEAAENREAAAYLAEQARMRAQWMQELDLAEAELMYAYDLLEWCDALSLLLGRNDIQPEERIIEISTGPDKQRYYLHADNNGTLHVDPWPFEQESFSVHLEYRQIQQIQFTSSEEFRQAFIAAPALEKKWNFSNEARESGKLYKI